MCLVFLVFVAHEECGACCLAVLAGAPRPVSYIFGFGALVWWVATDSVSLCMCAFFHGSIYLPFPPVSLTAPGTSRPRTHLPPPSRIATERPYSAGRVVPPGSAQQPDADWSAGPRAVGAVGAFDSVSARNRPAERFIHASCHRSVAPAWCQRVVVTPARGSHVSCTRHAVLEASR